MGRVTICDIAKRLGISTTTVNSALNSKGRISDETRQLVIRTADEMGFRPNKAAMSLARKPIKIGVIYTSNHPEFHDEIIRGAKTAQKELADFNVEGEFHVFSLPNSRLEVLKKMKEMGDSGINGIIVSPTDDLRGFNDIIDELKYKGIPVATIVSDVPEGNRAFSVRINGRVAGKMAAEVLWWLTKGGTVAIFTGMKDRGVHKEYITGFMEQVEKMPMDVVAIYENQEDPNIAYYATDKLLREYPDIDGIYISSVNSETVCKKIVESGVQGRVKIVASDIFGVLNGYLGKGVIQATIFQNPFRQGRLAFRYLYEHIAEGRRIDREVLIQPQLVFESNLELFLKEPG